MLFTCMEYKKEDLEQLILVDRLSYKEIGRRYGVSDTFIKKKGKELGIQLPIRKVFPNGFKPHNHGCAKKKLCLNCGNEIVGFIYEERKYCSSKCASDHRVKLKWEHYLKNEEKYDASSSMFFTKKHILKEQKNRCAVCSKLDLWNKKKLVFVLDHIDGDASNNARKNLRLVCPNCDSQLPTFKSKNRNSARKERYLKNYKN